MDFQEYVNFAKKHPICYMATAEGDQPRVRPLAMWFADETGFYFHTAAPKALYKQLEKNNKVELSFYAPGKVQDEIVMRVAGLVEIVDNIELKKRVLKDRPFLLETGINGPEDPNLIIIRVYSGEVYFWTMEYSLRESELERTKF